MPYAHALDSSYCPSCRLFLPGIALVCGRVANDSSLGATRSPGLVLHPHDIRRQDAFRRGNFVERFRTFRNGGGVDGELDHR